MLPHRATRSGPRHAHEIERWPQFVPTALEAGFEAVHAVPMRAAGAVLGALGLFDTRPKELTEADRLVGQTLAHIACVAVLQEHPPTRNRVAAAARRPGRPRPGRTGQGLPQRDAGVSVADAFGLLRAYSRTRGEHLTDVARRLMTDRHTRPETVRALAELARHSERRSPLTRPGPPHRLLDQPLGDLGELDVFRLADLAQPLEGLLLGAARAAADDADRLIDHRPRAQRLLQLRRALPSVGQQLRVVHRTAAGPENSTERTACSANASRLWA